MVYRAYANALNPISILLKCVSDVTLLVKVRHEDVWTSLELFQVVLGEFRYKAVAGVAKMWYNVLSTPFPAKIVVKRL